MNFDNYINSRFYSFFDYLYLIIITNFLWAIFNGVGLVVLTFMPATLALFIILKDKSSWGGFGVIKAFVNIIKREYLKSQLIFLLLIIIGSIIMLNAFFFYNASLTTNNYFYHISFYLTLVIALGYMNTLIHIFPVYIYFPKLSSFKTIKYAFLLSIGYFFHSIFLLMLIIIIGIVSMVMPFLPFIVSVSACVAIILKVLKNKYTYLSRDTKDISLHAYLN